MPPAVDGAVDRPTVRSGSQAVERAMAVLGCFAGETELTLTDVASRTGLPVSTTYRIMQALLRSGFLQRGEADAYRIGGRVADLVPRRSVADEVAPYLHALAARLGIAVSFGVLDGTEVSTLVSARPPVRYCEAQIPGRHEPLHATAMGKILLAFHPGGPGPMCRRLGVLRPYTSRTRTSAAALLADLEESRRRGYALSDGEWTEGVRAVAVPVVGADRRPVGAIGVQAKASRLTAELVPSLVPVMHRIGQHVTRRLGDEPPYA